MKSGEEIKATGWTHLMDLVYHGSWKKSLRRFRSNYAFRGASRVDSHLITALMRLGGKYEAVENHLLRNFRKYAHSNAVSGDSIWNWMAVGQHHGLPTRLLDWTYSPLVALHFATKDLQSFGQDSILWCVDYEKTNHYLPPKLQKLLQQEGSYVFTAEMLHSAAASLRDFDQIDSKHFVVFFEPPSLDDRIVNQFALFSLMSTPRADLEQWLEDKPETYKRIIIPASLKAEVRDKLDQANITERVMFPGLDGLSAWLTRYYTPLLEQLTEPAPKAKTKKT